MIKIDSVASIQIYITELTDHPIESSLNKYSYTNIKLDTFEQFQEIS